MIGRRFFLKLITGVVFGPGISTPAQAADCPWRIESDGTVTGTKIYFENVYVELVTDIVARSTDEYGVWLLDVTRFEPEYKPVTGVKVFSELKMKAVTNVRATVVLQGMPLRPRHGWARFVASARDAVVSLKYYAGDNTNA